MSDEIQKDEWYIPGNLGTIRVGEKVRQIDHLIKHSDGSVTLSIGMAQYPKPEQNTEETSFEIIQPKQLI